MKITDLLPPTVTLALKVALGKTSFYGNYESWQSAQARSGTYTVDLEAAARMLRANTGSGTSLHSWAVAVGLLMPRASRVKVLDFGGGLASMYWQMRPLLDAVRMSCDWRTVELPEVVAYGSAHLAGEDVTFHASIDEARRDFEPDVVIAGGVLQYLPDPYGTMLGLCELGAAAIVLDRTPVAERERIMVQRLDRQLGGHRFPIRLLDEKRLRETWSDRYTMLSANDWNHGESGLHGGFRYMSYILVKRGPTDGSVTAQPIRSS